jgi:dihydrolipoamide dehydrogenase
VADANTVYDLVVIGSGPGGYVGAIRAGQLGLRVALVEKDPFFGGTCLHRGCIPAKSLLQDAAVFHQTLHALEHGVQADNVRIDFSKVQKRKTDIVGKLSRGVEGLLKKNKVDAMQGFGRLAAPDRVAVQRPDGGTLELRTRNVMLATGSVPRSLPGLEIDGDRVLNSDHVLDLQQVPESMVILGAGAVGVEFASAFSRFGSRVVLVELLPRVVPLEDEDSSKELERAFRKQKIEVHTNTRYEAVERTERGVRVRGRTAKGDEKSWEADKLVVATGRGPVSQGLGLEEAGIRMERGFVLVDDHLRTNVPGVWAIGDLVPTPGYAHTASSEAILVAEQIGGLEVHPLNYDHTPNCTYCEPEVASVGLSEARAKEKGLEVRTGKFPLGVLGRSLILGETQGMVKIVADARFRELLGVHIVGPRATELIGEAVIALETESTVDELLHAQHAHPTVSEGIKEAAEGVFGKPIHV